MPREGSGYCLACSFDDEVPDLSDPQRLALWTETERAKRRLIYTLLTLGLPLWPSADKRGLRFRLLADERVDTGAVEPPAQGAVVIGHDQGQLTMNVVEADDAHREAMRNRLNEPYRTMLGHLRHEVGHYYWYRLVEGTELIEISRAVRRRARGLRGRARRTLRAASTDGWQSLRQPYAQRASVGRLRGDLGALHSHRRHAGDRERCAAQPCGPAVSAPLPLAAERPFAAMLGDWLPLTVALNQLNRSMGMRDAYPFALTDRVVDKLAFVHRVCLDATARAS